MGQVFLGCCRPALVVFTPAVGGCDVDVPAEPAKSPVVATAMVLARGLAMRGRRRCVQSGIFEHHRTGLGLRRQEKRPAAQSERAQDQRTVDGGGGESGKMLAGWVELPGHAGLSGSLAAVS